MSVPKLDPTDPRPLALVTGASSGIGEAYARLLARNGHDLWLVARRTERLEALAAELSATGASCRIQVCDLSDRLATQTLAEAARHEPRLSVLVHAAGFGVHGHIGEAAVERLQAMADVHVSATIALCSAASPGMGRRKTGSIVVVSSIAAWMAGAGSVTYGATKSFQAVFAQALARELCPLGVRVQALCPGYTMSEFHDTPEYAHWSRDSVPRIFWSTPDFVACESWKALGKTVVFLPGRLNRLLVAVGGSALGVRLRERIRRSRM